MATELEQRALRIWNEVHENGKKLPDVIEFARRLMAEQGEPVAEIAYAGIGDTRRLQFVAVKETLPDKTKLYASPPQDALDAKRYRWLRDMWWFGGALDADLTHALTSDELDAAIDAAIRAEGGK